MRVRFGLTTEQIDAMRASMGLVPDTINPLIALSGADKTQLDLTLIKAELEKVPPNTPITIEPITDDAKTKLEEIGLKVENITKNGHPQVRVSAETGGAVSQIQTLLDTMMNVRSELTITSALKQLGTFNSRDFNSYGDSQRARRGDNYQPGTASDGWLAYGRKDGGSIFGPGTERSDSIPIMASDNEHMWAADEVRGAGGHGNVEGLRAMARNGELAKIIGGFDQGGNVNDGSGKKPRMPWDTDAMAGIDAAAIANGMPYISNGGSVNPAAGGMDCSGYLSWIFANMTGRDPGQRWFTTESDFASLGFVPGFAPGALNIGIRRGGGGADRA